jgi:hypothetical protein
MNLIAATICLFGVLALASGQYEMGTCSCFVNIAGGDHLGQGLLRDILTYGAFTAACDSSGYEACKQHCTEYVELTDGGWFTEIPALRDIDVSLGQLLCNILGQDVEGSKVELWSSVQCEFPKDTDQPSGLRFTNTGVSPNKLLRCKSGRFIE